MKTQPSSPKKTNLIYQNLSQSKQKGKKLKATYSPSISLIEKPQSAVSACASYLNSCPSDRHFPKKSLSPLGVSDFRSFTSIKSKRYSCFSFISDQTDVENAKIKSKLEQYNSVSKKK